MHRIGDTPVRWIVILASGIAFVLGACSAPAQPAATVTSPSASAATPIPPPPAQSPLPAASAATRAPTSSPNPPTPTPGPQHRVGVRSVGGQGEFFDRTTNQKFTPRGANYIRLANTATPCVESGVFYHSTFNVGRYNAVGSERALEAMQAQGFNTVRVFLNHMCIVTSDGKFSQEYLQNLVDFLVRAKAHALAVIIAIDNPPGPGYANDYKHDPQIDFANRGYLQHQGVEVEGKFWSDLIHALVDLKAPMDVIFAYSLRNEMSYLGNVPPFSLTSGTVATGNGKGYDVAEPKARQAMMDDNLVFWIDQTRARILEVDPMALVTVGFFVPQTPNPTRVGDHRLTRTLPALARSTADFIDLHTYPAQGLTLAQYAENFEVNVSGKPILMGEFGATRQAISSAAATGQALQDWQIESCKYGFDGWLLWTWDLAEDKVFWSGADEGGQINRWLAPSTRPDACKPATSLTLNARPAASGSRQVQGTLFDVNSKPIPNRKVTYVVKPLDGPGTFGTYTLENVVPTGATQAVVGLRLNIECESCRGTTELMLYNASYVQGSDAANRVVNPDYARNMETWGISSTAAMARVETSDYGSGRMLHIRTATPLQTVMLNSGQFPVSPGEKFRATFEARVAPVSVGSGYWAVIFVAGNKEVQRQTLALEPATIGSGDTRTDANGAFQFRLSTLPNARIQIQATYSGDDDYFPGRTTLAVAP